MQALCTDKSIVSFLCRLVVGSRWKGSFIMIDINQFFFVPNHNGSINKLQELGTDLPTSFPILLFSVYNHYLLMITQCPCIYRGNMCKYQKKAIFLLLINAGRKVGRPVQNVSGRVSDHLHVFFVSTSNCKCY